jgi:hypothetical protein
MVLVESAPNLTHMGLQTARKKWIEVLFRLDNKGADIKSPRFILNTISISADSDLLKPIADRSAPGATISFFKP